MTRKNGLPQFPHDYIGEKANEYDNLHWMEEHQKETTRKCVNFLFDPKLGEYEVSDFSNYVVADLGCGTGFSSEILTEFGFNVLGIDILEDMLLKSRYKKDSKKSNQIYELLLGSITKLPIRPKRIDFIISVSAYNFITHNTSSISEMRRIINSTARYLSQILRPEGRMVIEFYPGNEQILNLYLTSFKESNFNGFHIKGERGGQYFILLKKKDP